MGENEKLGDVNKSVGQDDDIILREKGNAIYLRRGVLPGIPFLYCGLWTVDCGSNLGTVGDTRTSLPCRGCLLRTAVLLRARNGYF